MLYSSDRFTHPDPRPCPPSYVRFLHIHSFALPAMAPHTHKSLVQQRAEGNDPNRRRRERVISSLFWWKGGGDTIKRKVRVFDELLSGTFWYFSDKTLTCCVTDQHAVYFSCLQNFQTFTAVFYLNTHAQVYMFVRFVYIKHVPLRSWINCAIKTNLPRINK